MIGSLTNFTKKSFTNYSGPLENFKKKNLFFGYNGRGKSSLATGIIEQYKEKGHKDSSYRLFNKEFIKKNVLLENSNNKFNGVKAIFGKKDVDSEKKIEELTASIQDEEGINEQIQTYRSNVRDLIDSKHDSKKGLLSINRKAKRESIEKILELYRKDIEVAKKIQPDEEILAKYQGDDKLEKELSRFEKYNLATFCIDVPSKEELKRMSFIFEKSFDDLSIPSSEVISWLNSGLELHNEEDDCKFCGNPFNYNQLKEKVKEYNNNERQKAHSYLDKVKKDVEVTINKLSDLLKDKESIEDNLEAEKISEYFMQLELSMEKLMEFFHTLTEKINDLGSMLLFNQEEIEKALSSINEYNESLNNLRLKKITELKHQIDNQEILVKGAIGIEVLHDKKITEQIKIIENEEENLAIIRKENYTIREEISKLVEQQSEYGDFLILLNEVFQSMDINLKLIKTPNGENYLLQHSKTKEALNVDDVSEGERNLLALMFFYYELYDDKQQKFLKKSIELIVIDDPISSLDDANKFFVLGLMKKLFSEKQPQIFIMTHVWDDFCQLSYKIDKLNNKKEAVVEFFEIYKDEDSNSQLRIIKTGIRPYKKLFKEIYQVSKKTKNDTLTDFEIYHIPNSMRRVLEEFLSFKSEKSLIPQKSNQDAIEKIICTAMDSDSYITSAKRQNLGLLLNIINILSHEIQYQPNEMIKSARFMMKLLEEMDKAHYVAMIN